MHETDIECLFGSSVGVVESACRGAVAPWSMTVTHVCRDVVREIRRGEGVMGRMEIPSSKGSLPTGKL